MTRARTLAGLLRVCTTGGDTNWKQTSYNNNIRKNYAGIGYTYDPSRDAFISPKCHEGAILDEATCRWVCLSEEHEFKVVI